MHHPARRVARPISCARPARILPRRSSTARSSADRLHTAPVAPGAAGVGHRRGDPGWAAAGGDGTAKVDGWGGEGELAKGRPGRPKQSWTHLTTSHWLAASALASAAPSACYGQCARPGYTTRRQHRFVPRRSIRDVCPQVAGDVVNEHFLQPRPVMGRGMCARPAADRGGAVQAPIPGSAWAVEAPAQAARDRQLAQSSRRSTRRALH